MALRISSFMPIISFFAKTGLSEGGRLELDHSALVLPNISHSYETQQGRRYRINP